MMQISSRTMTPFVLAGLIYLAALFTMLMEKAAESGGLLTYDAERTWTIATSLLLLFAVFVSILLLRTTGKVSRFWNQSMIAFVSLAIVTNFTAQAFSGKPVGEVGSFKFLYLVVTIGFLVFISIVNLTRKIVEFAEKEEWNQPRMRSKKKR
jgi:hypothetical protein